MDQNPFRIVMIIISL